MVASYMLAVWRHRPGTIRGPAITILVVPQGKRLLSDESLEEFRADLDDWIRDVYNPVSIVDLRSRHSLAMNG
jgi:hypothetical protein